MPVHHPNHTLLTEYVGGGLDEAVSILVATHLALCPSCRDQVEIMDAVAGSLFAETTADTSAEVGDELLAAVLARLDDPEPPAPPPPPSAEGPHDIPLPLRRFTGSLSKVPFGRVVPGIRRFDLPMSTDERPVALVSLRPGLVVPPHRHNAPERGLVLVGGFTDEVGHFVRGDVSIRLPDEDEPHRQRIDDGQDCIVLMVDDGPKIPTTAMGKVVNFLFGM